MSGNSSPLLTQPLPHRKRLRAFPLPAFSKLKWAIRYSRCCLRSISRYLWHLAPTVVPAPCDAATSIGTAVVITVTGTAAIATTTLLRGRVRSVCASNARRRAEHTLCYLVLDLALCLVAAELR